MANNTYYYYDYRLENKKCENVDGIWTLLQQNKNSKIILTYVGTLYKIENCNKYKTFYKFVVDFYKNKCA